MSPQIIRMVSPKARMVVTDICLETFERLAPVRKLGLMSAETATRKPSTRRML